MSRKHFQAAADSLALIADLAARRVQADAMAALFARANPRFNRSRFLAACGL